MDFNKDGDRFMFIHEDPTDSSSKVVACLIDNEPANFCVVATSEANQLARWQLITKELEFAEAQLSLAISRMKNANFMIKFDRRDPEGVIIKSLIDSAIVGYIKCFNQTKGRRVKLEVRELFDKKGEKYFREHHIAVRELRDSYIAHAGISKNEGSHMLACIDKKSPVGQSREVVLAHSIFIWPELEFLESTLNLVRYVHNIHLKKYQDRLNQFCQKLIDDPVNFGVESVFQPQP